MGSGVAMTRRAMHPADARMMLITFSKSRAHAEKLVDASRRSLPTVVKHALEAGLTKAEIAELAGVSRETIHRASQVKGRTR